MFGYTGKLLFVDLTTGKTEVRALDEATAKNFIGGPSLGAKILYDEMPANTPVFAPESMVGFVSGPTNGTGALMGGRYTVVSKSPVTGGWNDANSGGNFGPILRKSGYDGVFVKGISEKPVYIFIDDGKVELRDASKIWGLTTVETENAIKEELGDKNVGIALIGPAGENLSNMAAVMNDNHRAAGRGGSGAVMGSKKLKALVCRGNQKLEVKDKAKLVELNKETVAWEKSAVLPVFSRFSDYGTGGLYESSILGGDGSVRNWAGSAVALTDEEIRALTSEAMDLKFKRKKYACNACPVGCGAIYDIVDGKWPHEDTGRPEYETLGMFGSQMMNSNVESVNHCNWLANQYGFDSISLGATVAWLMECYSNGLFTIDELDGIDLKWGNTEAIVAMTELICQHKGIGAILAQGSRAAAKHFNRGFEYLVVASGIEIPQHDARFSPGLARTYQYDPTPGRHVKGGLSIHYGNNPPEVKYNYDNTGKADLAGTSEQELQNAAGFCYMGGFGLPPASMPKYIEAITGFAYNEEEVFNLGLRSYTIRHAFNLREGLRRKDFDISDRIVGKPPLKEGPLAGVTVDDVKLADNFFKEIGWDLETAMPPKEFLEKVGGLENVVKDLYK
jgi:aldehyde:ferredoxin oxidoreductase